MYFGGNKGLKTRHFVWNHMAYSLDIWHLASSSRPLQSFFKLCPLGQKFILMIGPHALEVDMQAAYFQKENEYGSFRIL